MSRFPTGVTVVTCLRDGEPYGLTCTAFCGVSLDPPTVLVCLGRDSGTLATIRDAGRFAVNLLHAHAQAVAELFATPVPDRFAQCVWRCTPGGQPWLTTSSQVVADCTFVEATEVGDHVVVFGRVEDVVLTPRTPLLYGLRRYRSWPS